MSITVNSHDYTVFGNRSVILADIAMDSSYPSGGEAFNPETLFGLHRVESVLIENKNGYAFEFDATNKKIKTYMDFAPAMAPIVYEEHHVADLTTGAITLDHPAAFIMNVAVPGQNLALRSTGVTLANLGSNQACLSAQMAAGTVAGLICKPANDELAGDGAFTGGTTNWTFNATPWTYGTNALEKDAGGVNALTHDTFAAVVGRTYKLSLSLAAQGANPEVIGSLTPTLGGTAGAATTDATTGTYTWNIKATTTGGLSITPTTAARFVLDAITIVCQDIYTTYVTQAWKDVWDNLVQDETLTLATGDNTLDTGNKILACMYVDQTTATAAALTMVDEDDTTASGEIRVMFNAATAQLNCHSDQNAKAVKITYIKNPGSGFLYERAFNNTTATKVGVDPYLNTFAKTILLWGYAGQMPVNTGTTQKMIDTGTTAAAGEFVIDYFNGSNRGTPTTPTAAGASHDHALSGSTDAGASHDHAISGSTDAGASHDHAMSGSVDAGSSHNHVFTGTAEAPIIKVEEVVTVTTNVGTLSHVPLYISAVQVTAGGTTGAFSVIPTGETPLTYQVAVTFTTGVLTFLNTDSVTSAKVTYIPKRAAGFLSSVTVDETVVAAAAKTNLAARAGLIQYVWDDTDGVLDSLEQVGTEPSATHFVEIDINDSGASSIDAHSDDEGNSLKVTYIPFTQLPPGCFVDDIDITLSSEVWNFTGDPGVLGYNNLVVPGYGVNVIGEDGTTARAAAIWEGPSGTAADGVATWNPAMNSIVTNNTTAATILSMPWMVLSPLFLTPATPVGTNAAEASHTHAVGSLDAAAESTHTHAVGSLDAAAEATHTHAVGSLDAAAEATHTHAITATSSFGTIVDLKSNVTGTAAGVWGLIDEIPPTGQIEVSGVDLSALSSIKVVIIGV